MQMTATTGAVDLTTYDVVLVNSSAGKDSQAMLDYLVELADSQGVERSRLVVVHCDLGRVEWKGTRALAEEQARHYGLRFEVVRREQDLLDQVAQRGMWPGAGATRYCTSDHKRDQVAKLLTRLVDERRGTKWQPVRILNCQGIRAQESDARAAKLPFQVDTRATNGKRHVDLYYPIFTWSLEQVWQRIRQSGVRHHEAYDLGMSRLSCCFCIMGSKPDLLIAAQANPELLDTYCQVEEQIGHSFTHKLSIRSLRSLAQATSIAQGNPSTVTA